MAATAGVTSSQAGDSALPDLKLSFGPVESPASINQFFTVSVLITNRSDVDASKATVQLQIPQESTPFLVSPPVIAPSVTVTWTNLSLAAHTALTVTNQIRFKSAGIARVNAQVSAGADANFADNQASLSIPIAYSLADSQLATLGYRAASVVFDEKRGDLLAVATGGDFSGELVAIAPDTGLVKDHWNIGADPSQIVLGRNPDVAYALTDNGANLVVLDRDTFAVKRTTPMGGINDPGSELYLDPGDSRQLVVGSILGHYQLFVDGEPTSVAFADGRFLGYYSSHSFLGNSNFGRILNRYHITPEGIEPDYSSNMPFSEDLVFSSGRLFSKNGYAFDVEDGFNATYLGQEGYPSFDPGSRIVYLTTRAPDVVRLVDLDTQTLLRTQGFSNAGSIYPAIAVPAGREYVAVWTKTSIPGFPGSISIIRSKFAGGAGTTDVSLANSSSAGSNTRFTWTLAIVNKGPFPAKDAWIDVQLPAGAYLAQVPGERLPTVFNEPDLSYFLGSIPVGTTYFTLTADVPPGTPNSSGLASFRTSSRDSNPSDNQANLYRAGSPVIPTTKLAGRPLTFPPTDLVYNAHDGYLYITEALGNLGALEVTDTNRHTLSSSQLPGPPDKVAISDDGKYFYVSLRGARKFLRLSGNPLAVDFEVSPAFAADAPTNAVMSLIPLLGQPRTVAVSQYTPGRSGGGGVWIYDDATPRPTFIPGGSTGIRAIQPGRTPDELIGFHDPDGVPMKLTVSSNGVVAEPFVTEYRFTANQEFYTRGDKLLAWPGVILTQGDFTVKASQSTFIPDAIAFSADGNQGILGAKSGDEYRFTDIRTGRADAGVVLHSHITNSPIQKLISWGETNIAFITRGALVTGPLIFGDSNQDGIPDWWVLAHGFDPQMDIADLDTDGDGVSNRIEYLSGTDPQNAASFPKMALFRHSNGTVRINFNALSDQQYTLERATHLAPGDWTPVLNGVSGGGTQSVQDDPADDSAFYRIKFTP